ncbi:MAG: hypothetical protein KBF76_12730 [Verrucomicrobiales bacterium]|nr:hypothetical protein [Verrucomicrobiales bacterium]
MTTLHRIAFLLLPSIFLLSSNAAPPPELTILRQQYEKAYVERVTAPFEASEVELNDKYSAGLDRAITEAKKAGNLQDIIAIEAEKKRLVDKIPIPEADLEDEPETLTRLRTIYRQQWSVISAAREQTAGEMLPPFITKLRELEAILVKNDRVDEAKEVLAYREDLDSQALPPTSPNVTEAPPMPVEIPKGKGDERRAAEWVLSVGGQLTLKDGPVVQSAEKLPSGRFAIAEIALDGEGAKQPITAEAIALLVGLEDLRVLKLTNLEIPGESLAFLGSLPALSRLSVDNLPRIDSAIPFLSDSKQLQHLGIVRCEDFTGVTLGTLVALPKFSEVYAFNTSLGDDGIAQIAQIKAIEFVGIPGCNGITDACLPALRGLPKLSKLNLSGCYMITPEALATVPMPHIEALGFTSINRRSLAETAPIIAPAFPNVSLIILSYYIKSPDDIAALVHFPKLEEFQIDSVNFTSGSFARISELRSLRHISINVNKFPDTDFRDLATSRSLETIVFVNTTVSDASLLHLAEAKKLKTVSGTGKSTTPAGLAAFRKARPDVRIVE